MKDAIQKLSIRKAAELDRILNKIITTALTAITIPLANTATTYFFKSKTPDYCKKKLL